MKGNFHTRCEPGENGENCKTSSDCYLSVLKITSDGRKIRLDQRLINPMLPDFKDSKVNACTERVYHVWDKTKADSLTQLIFCDFSTPKSDGKFNVYDDIKQKLLLKGIPEHEIAFIHDADNETKKKALFAKVRHGKVRVLFGSTAKMGSGTNIQDRLVEIHDLDCPWRPSDLEQRAGRIVRQGNQNKEVSITRYVTESSFDAYLYQTVENKQKFISQIMSEKSHLRSCEDVDESVLSYAEIKALCAGNPHIKEKMNLDIELSRLNVLKAESSRQKYRLDDNIKKDLPKLAAALDGRIDGLQKAAARTTAQSKPHSMTVQGIRYGERPNMGKALLTACQAAVGKESAGSLPIEIGEYRGFSLFVHFDTSEQEYKLTLRNETSIVVKLGTDGIGNLTRIDNAIEGLPNQLANARDQRKNVDVQFQNALTEFQKPFPFEAEIREKTARLEELNTLLKMEEKSPSERDNAVSEAPEANQPPPENPSVLDALQRSKAQADAVPHKAHPAPKRHIDNSH